ncbi:MAG TPA: FAD:protein FMN transferase [Streptosporangiaceae bacterium]|nr:FAD:protein FMN transferase [Streptosporangiaceae bacterium]
MSATALLHARPAWSRVSVGSLAVAAADRDALGTTARLAVWPAANLTAMLAAVDDELAALDAQASRFRADSEISALHAAGAGRHQVSDGLAEAIRIALAAAAWTGGRCDPTVGSALVRIGYDRDFAAIAENDAPIQPGAGAAPGWQAIALRGNVLTAPPGVLLDLGATAKGLGADRAAAAAFASAGEGGVLVSLGGDIAVAGRPPAGGWPVLIADEHRQVRAARNLAAPAVPRGAADPAIAQQVRLASGGLATSSSTCRRWVRAGRVLHHIIDPRTGMPAGSPWRTVTVAAATCAEANAASTAAIVAGEDAPGWLGDHGLPARLISHDGQIIRTGGWPEAEDGPVCSPGGSWLAALIEGGDR